MPPKTKKINPASQRQRDQVNNVASLTKEILARHPGLDENLGTDINEESLEKQQEMIDSIASNYPGQSGVNPSIQPCGIDGKDSIALLDANPPIEDDGADDFVQGENMVSYDLEKKTSTSSDLPGTSVESLLCLLISKINGLNTGVQFELRGNPLDLDVQIKQAPSDELLNLPSLTSLLNDIEINKSPPSAPDVSQNACDLLSMKSRWLKLMEKGYQLKYLDKTCKKTYCIHPDNEEVSFDIMSKAYEGISVFPSSDFNLVKRLLIFQKKWNRYAALIDFSPLRAPKQ